MFASTCINVYQKVDEEAKKYLRISSHITEYGSSCNVVYAYSAFLDNPAEMDVLENDNVYAENLGVFVKNYPYLSKLIFNREIFEQFDKLYSDDKIVIDEMSKRLFTSRELENKKNIVYITFALSVVGEDYDLNKLLDTTKHLKKRYTLKEMDVLVIFWSIFQQKYTEKNYSSQKLFNSFEEIVSLYGMSTLKEYVDYASDFYPVLIPKIKSNEVYISVIKSLLGEIKYISPEGQAYFLKNISLDIQIAIENKNNKYEIVQYFRAFITKKFILQFGNLSCFEKQGLAMLVSDHLDDKLDWSRDNKAMFPTLIRNLRKERSQGEIINLLGLYNYAASVYVKMKTSKQKQMFEKIINLPTDSLLFNLSLIYTLDSQTTYFSMIVNNPDFMYDQNKYIDIFYVSRNGHMILNLFREQKQEFISEINELVLMPSQNIHDLTTIEKTEIAFDMADYASYATMLIPGVGIAVQIGKSLAKTGIKKAIKIGMKQSIKNTLKTMKQQSKDYWNDAVKYTGNKSKDIVINKHVLKTDRLLTGTLLSGITYHYFFDQSQKSLCRER